jgi:transposase
LHFAPESRRLDPAKHVFQVHGIDASARVVVAKAIRRNKLLEFFASLPACLVGLEPAGRRIIGRAS